jgi:hypothetical protein
MERLRRAQPYYVPHLYYALHFHAFVFLMLAFRVALSFSGTVGAAGGGLFPLLIVPYHYIGLRRVFGGTGRQVAWKGTVIGFVYTALIAATMFVLVILTIRNAIPAATPQGLRLP